MSYVRRPLRIAQKCITKQYRIRQNSGSLQAQRAQVEITLMQGKTQAVSYEDAERSLWANNKHLRPEPVMIYLLR